MLRFSPILWRYLQPSRHAFVSIAFPDLTSESKTFAVKLSSATRRCAWHRASQGIHGVDKCTRYVTRERFYTFLHQILHETEVSFSGRRLTLQYDDRTRHPSLRFFFFFLRWARFSGPHQIIELSKSALDQVSPEVYGIKKSEVRKSTTLRRRRERLEGESAQTETEDE